MNLIHLRIPAIVIRFSCSAELSRASHGPLALSMCFHIVTFQWRSIAQDSSPVAFRVALSEKSLTGIGLRFALSNDKEESRNLCNHQIREELISLGTEHGSHDESDERTVQSSDQ